MKSRLNYLWGAAVVLLLALAGLAYLGTFTRFHADDFCMAGDAIQIGFGPMLAKWYSNWTGRYMFILGTGFFGLGGPGFAAWLPALAEAAWLAGLSWAILPTLRRAGWRYPRLMSGITSSFGLVVLLSSTPNLFQSFFWQDGFVNYSLPLIGLTISCGIILRAWLNQASTWASAAGMFFLAFICGGFTESLSAMQVTLFGLAFCAALAVGDRRARGRLLLVLGAALAGGLVALLVVIAAPGNQVRAAAVGEAPGLVRIFTFSIRNAAFIFGKFFIKTPVWAGISLAGPFLAGWLYFDVSGVFFEATASLRKKHPDVNLPDHLSRWRQESWLRWLVGIGLASFILVTAACAPVVYALNAYPDDRTIIIPQAVIIAAVFSASTLLGAGLRGRGILPDPLRPAFRRVLPAEILAAVLVGAGFSAWQTAAQVPDFQEYARAWDQRGGIIQQAAASGLTDVSVAGLPARFGVADLNADPGNWVNRCMGSYYRIPTLRGR